MPSSEPPPASWNITVPSMLVDAPLVVVVYREDVRSGYIEIPCPPQVVAVDETGRAVKRVRCPVDGSRLGAIVAVMKGWPLR